MSATATVSQSAPVTASKFLAAAQAEHVANCQAPVVAKSVNVVLNAAMPARVILKHVEAGVTDVDALVTLLTETVYPIGELVQLATVLGAEFAGVLAAQQGLAVAVVAKAPAKKSCAVSRAEFLADAKAIDVVLNGVPMSAGVKEFSTGSLGWNLTGKMQVTVGGKSVMAQVGLNITVIGSKELA
jgi:hypothetical protein